MRKTIMAIALIGASFGLSGCYRHHVGGYGDHGYHDHGGGDHGGGDHGGGGDGYHGG